MDGFTSYLVERFTSYPDNTWTTFYDLGSKVKVTTEVKVTVANTLKNQLCATHSCNSSFWRYFRVEQILYRHKKQANPWFRADATMPLISDRLTILVIVYWSSFEPYDLVLWPAVFDHRDIWLWSSFKAMITSHEANMQLLLHFQFKPSISKIKRFRNLWGRVFLQVRTYLPVAQKTFVAA